jgi:DNA modification methylase
MNDATCRIIVGDARTVLAQLPAGCARCCVTSPPYWGLRDYGIDGQIGLEATPEAWVADLVRVFAEVRRVLADDGTLWVNCGDAYSASGRGGNPGGPTSTLEGSQDSQEASMVKQRATAIDGLKPKDLIGLPWLLAFALRADGWYLRSDIIWHKPNPMPESVTDRPTKSHEYVFLLSKSPRYYFDAGAIAEPIRSDPGSWKMPDGFATHEGAHGSFHRDGREKGRKRMLPIGGVKAVGVNGNATYSGNTPEFGDTRNARTVWTIPTQGYSGAHFATFPRELAARCIKAGSAAGDLVLDPFLGTGTTIGEALMLGRRGVGVELNPEYARLAEKRIAETCPLFSR